VKKKTYNSYKEYREWGRKVRNGTLTKEEALQFQKWMYNIGYSSLDDWTEYQRFIRLERVRWIHEHLKPDDVVLDVGCGEGFIARRIIEQVKEVVGIDISEEGIRRAKRVNNHHRIKYLVQSFEDFNSDRKFDVILMYELLEHIYDAESANRKATDLLKENGLLAISTPNRDRLSNRLWRFVYKVLKNECPVFMTGEHICEYNSKEIYNMLRKNGFKILKSKGAELFSTSLIPFKFPFARNQRLEKNRLNYYIGSLLPSLAILGFYLARKHVNEEGE